MLAPMAYRRAAAMATVSAAGAASALWRRATTGGGLVPGQDTPVHEKELPENVKQDFRQVSEHFPDEPTAEAAGGSGGSTSTAGSGQPREHPDEMSDPYSGADPYQKQGGGGRK